MQHDHILKEQILFSYGGDFWPQGQNLKKKSHLELWWPFCSAEWNHLCNFCKGHYEEQFCEIILNFDQWFKRNCH